MILITHEYVYHNGKPVAGVSPMAALKRARATGQVVVSMGGGLNIYHVVHPNPCANCPDVGGSCMVEGCARNPA